MTVSVEAPAPASSGVRQVVWVYIVFAALWLGLSDVVMAWLIVDPAQRALAGVVEDGCFIAVTAALLYVLVRRLLRRQQQAFVRERDALPAQDRTQGLLHALAESTPDAIFAKDREGRYLLFNREAGRVIGRSAGQVLGRDDGAVFPAAQAVMIRANDERVMAQDRPETFEEELDTADGRITFLSTKGPLHDATGRVVGLFGISRDITGRRRAEAALRLSEQRFRLAAVGGQVWDWDLASGRVEFPAAFWQLLGRAAPPAEACVAHLEALMHPDDLPRWRQALRDHLVQRAPYDLVFRALAADGHWRSFHTEGQAVWDAAGRATYMAGTTFDITERKRAEAALRESEAYRRNLFDQLGDAVLLIDTDQRFLDANPQALQMLGYTRDELLRRGVRDVVPAAERARIDASIARVMDGLPPQLADWEFLRHDGSRFFAEASARRLDERRFVAVVRDITARRSVQQALLTTQSELSDLAHRLLAQERTTTQRVAQALHDQLGQTLAVARLNLDACISTHAAQMPAALRAQSDQLAALLDQAVREVRQVLVDLRPPLLEDRGLAAALDNEIGTRAYAAGGADVLLEAADGAVGRRWPAEVEYGAFMVAREAITNARQHADGSLIRVLLDGDDAALDLDVIDDGSGIPDRLVHGRPGHLGIIGMRERAIAIGASFAVNRVPDGGTWVSLRWQTRRP